MRRAHLAIGAERLAPEVYLQELRGVAALADR
jgi:hypothetical protein